LAVSFSSTYNKQRPLRLASLAQGKPFENKSSSKSDVVVGLNFQSTHIFLNLNKKTAFLEAGSYQARGYFTLSYASWLNNLKTYVTTVYTARKTCQMLIYQPWGKAVNNKNSPF